MLKIIGAYGPVASGMGGQLMTRQVRLAGVDHQVVELVPRSAVGATASARSALRSRVKGLIEGLHDLGWVVGRNRSLEVRWSDNRVDRMPALARALHLESASVPVVLASGAGALRLGLIASLARPGGHVTGIENQLDELAAKQLEFLKEIAPQARRVLTLSSGLGAAEPDVRQGLRAAAKAHGIRLIAGRQPGRARAGGRSR